MSKQDVTLFWTCHSHIILNIRQLGFLDFDSQLGRIAKAADPLVKLDAAVGWELPLEEAKRKQRNSIQLIYGGANSSQHILYMKLNYLNCFN
jgi:hypothetical protein